MAEPDRAAVRVVIADNPGPLTLDGSRTYVVGHDPCVVVDPGPALGDHIDALEVAIGSDDVAAVCLTHGHPDHAAATRELRIRIAAPLAATRRSAEIAGLEPPEHPLAADTQIEFGAGYLAVIPAPGHSPDHVCFHWPEARALFAGDVVLGQGTSMIAPPEGDMADYLATLERLRRLDLAIIYPGHGPPVSDPGAMLEEYVRHRLEREDQVMEALTAGATTPSEVRARVYPDLDAALHRAAEGSVRAHLGKLVKEERAREIEGRFRPVE